MLLYIICYSCEGKFQLRNKFPVEVVTGISPNASKSVTDYETGLRDRLHRVHRIVRESCLNIVKRMKMKNVILFFDVGTLFFSIL